MKPLFKKLPSVFSLERSLVITDAVMRNLFYLNASTATPVEVIRHGIRGTQNVNSSEGQRNIANVQVTDSAKLSPNAEGLLVDFHVCFLDIAKNISACLPTAVLEGGKIDSDNQFRKSLEDFVDRAKQSEGIQEIARRYARNIANGRWLWRNRTIAQAIKVDVEFDNKVILFSATDIPLNSFNDYSEPELRLAEHIARCLKGEIDSRIHVTACLNFGMDGSIEVFPSQNYLGDYKTKGFSRSLYKHNTASFAKDRSNEDINVVGHAAIRDQKIGNALRTFDTWYDDYAITGLPIAIEPNGANLSADKFFRNKAQSAFVLLSKLNTIDPASPEGMFTLACLIRGGVYSGEKDKVKAEKGQGSPEESTEPEAEA